MAHLSFEVGDRVRIREWDDMVQEYGYYEYDDGSYIILTQSNVGFTSKMRFMCGKEFVIGFISSMILSGARVYPTPDNDLFHFFNLFTIVPDMLEPVVTEEELDEGKFRDVLFMT